MEMPWRAAAKPAAQNSAAPAPQATPNTDAAGVADGFDAGIFKTMSRVRSLWFAYDAAVSLATVRRVVPACWFDESDLPNPPTGPVKYVAGFANDAGEVHPGAEVDELKKW